MKENGRMSDAPVKPHDWKAGIKRIPLHAIFSLVGIGTRFLPPPFNLIALGGFALWRVSEEYKDYAGKRDTGVKALIDAGSQIGSAAAGAFIG